MAQGRFVLGMILMPEGPERIANEAHTTVQGFLMGASARIITSQRGDEDGMIEGVVKGIALALAHFFIHIRSSPPLRDVFVAELDRYMREIAQLDREGEAEKRLQQFLKEDR